MSIKIWLTSFLIISIPGILAASAHMVVVSLNWFSSLNYPIDHYKTYRGRRIFGDNKTYRGILIMIVFSIFFCYFQRWLLLGVFDNRPSLFQYESYSPLFYGILYGLGYTLFELPNSFIKRQRDIVPGKRGSGIHVIIDQADSVAGCLILLYPFSNFSIKFLIVSILLFTFVHMLINYLLFLMKLRKNPL